MGHGLQLDGSTRRQPLMNVGVVRTTDLTALPPTANRSSRVLACIASNEPSAQTPFDGWSKGLRALVQKDKGRHTLELLQEIARIVSTRNRREGLPSVNLSSNSLTSSLEVCQIILYCSECTSLLWLPYSK